MSKNNCHTTPGGGKNIVTSNSATKAAGAPWESCILSKQVTLERTTSALEFAGVGRVKLIGVAAQRSTYNEESLCRSVGCLPGRGSLKAGTTGADKWTKSSKQHKEVVFERCYFFLVFDLDKVAIEVLLKIFKWYEAHAWKKISDVHFEICGLFVA